MLRGLILEAFSESTKNPVMIENKCNDTIGGIALAVMASASNIRCVHIRTRRCATNSVCIVAFRYVSCHDVFLGWMYRLSRDPPWHVIRALSLMYVFVRFSMGVDLLVRFC